MCGSGGGLYLMHFQVGPVPVAVRRARHCNRQPIHVHVPTPHITAAFLCNPYRSHSYYRVGENDIPTAIALRLNYSSYPNTCVPDAKQTCSHKFLAWMKCVDP